MWRRKWRASCRLHSFAQGKLHNPKQELKPPPPLYQKKKASTALHNTSLRAFNRNNIGFVLLVSNLRRASVLAVQKYPANDADGACGFHGNSSEIGRGRKRVT